MLNKISENGGRFERSKHTHSNELAECRGKWKKMKQITKL